MGRRSKAREYAMLSLFPEFLIGEGGKETLDFLIEERKPGEEVKSFGKELFSGVLRNQEEIDKLIKKNLKNWNFDRVGNLEKVIMRIACFEVCYIKHTPISVILDEAFRLCEDYNLETSIKFINGVVGAISREVRGKEISSYKEIVEDIEEIEDTE